MKVYVQVITPGPTFRGLLSASVGRTEPELCCGLATLPAWS